MSTEADAGDAIVAATPTAVADEGAAPAVAEGAPPPAPAAPADPASQLLSRFDQFEQQFGERLSRLETPAAPAEPVADPEAQAAARAAEEDEILRGLLEELGEEDVAEDGGITVQGLMTLVDKRLQQHLSQRDARAAETAAEERRNEGWSRLEQQWPALQQDEAFQEAVGDRVIQEAQRIASAALPGDAEAWKRIANEPTFVARVLEEHFKGSEPAPQPNVPIERQSAAAGAAGAATPDGDDGDAIVAAMQSQRFRLGQPSS